MHFYASIQGNNLFKQTKLDHKSHEKSDSLAERPQKLVVGKNHYIG